MEKICRIENCGNKLIKGLEDGICMKCQEEGDALKEMAKEKQEKREADERNN